MNHLGRNVLCPCGSGGYIRTHIVNEGYIHQRQIWRRHIDDEVVVSIRTIRNIKSADETVRVVHIYCLSDLCHTSISVGEGEGYIVRADVRRIGIELIGSAV